MDSKSEKRRSPSARRAFDILELARKYELSAVEAEGLHQTAGGDLEKAEELARFAKRALQDREG